MPRKTPVRELQKEEAAPSSPLRRSSRISNSSPVPTKVVSRRSSASEASTSTPIVTRSRRASFTHDSEPIDDVQAEKKSTRPRRGLLSLNSDAEEKPVQTKTRGSSVPKEPPAEVKKTPRRRRSVSEDTEVKEDDSVKKGTRSGRDSITKKNDDTKSITKQISSEKRSKSSDLPASTPIKKKLSSSFGDIDKRNASSEIIDLTLEAIEEDAQEFDVVEQTESSHVSKKKKSETTKIDFDLSVINEASLTEEEVTPKKKAQNEDASTQHKPVNKSSEEDNGVKETIDLTSEDGANVTESAEHETSANLESVDREMNVNSEPIVEQKTSSRLETVDQTKTNANPESIVEQQTNPNPESIVEQTSSSLEPVDQQNTNPESIVEQKTNANAEPSIGQKTKSSLELVDKQKTNSNPEATVEQKTSSSLEHLDKQKTNPESIVEPKTNANAEPSIGQKTKSSLELVDKQKTKSNPETTVEQKTSSSLEHLDKQKTNPEAIVEQKTRSSLKNVDKQKTSLESADKKKTDAQAVEQKTNANTEPVVQQKTKSSLESVDKQETNTTSDPVVEQKPSSNLESADGQKTNANPESIEEKPSSDAQAVEQKTNANPEPIVQQKTTSSLESVDKQKTNAGPEPIDEDKTSRLTGLIIVQKPRQSPVVTSEKKNSEPEMFDCSDSSFTLQLSSSLLNDTVDEFNNKENIRPQEKPAAREPECEPMEVDFDVRISRNNVFKVMEPPCLKFVAVEEELEVATRVTDEMAEFLDEQIRCFSIGITKIEDNVSTGRTEKEREISSEKAEKDTSGTVQKNLNEKIASPAKKRSDEEVRDAASTVEITTPSKETDTVEESDETRNFSVVGEDKKASQLESPTQEIVQPSGLDENATITDVEGQVVPEQEMNDEPDRESSSSKKMDESGSPEKETVNEDKNLSKTSLEEDQTLESSTEDQFLEETEQSLNVENVTNTEENSNIHDKTDVCDRSESAKSPSQETENVSNLGREEETLSQTEPEKVDEDTNNDAKTETTNPTEKSTDKINLCDSDSSTSNSLTSDDEEGYKSPKKKLHAQICSVSDDEIITSNKPVMKLKKNIFDRSIDSRYCRVMRDVKDENDSNVIELTDSDEVFDSVDKEKEKEALNTDTNNDESNLTISVDETEPENEPSDSVLNEEKSVFSTSSRKRSSDRTSITLQETVKAGDDKEAVLSGRIHKVVDLFCAGIRKDSDVSVNVSLEYTGQASDSEEENKTELVEINLTAVDIKEKEIENQKGSKRRKICPSNDLESLQKEQPVTETTESKKRQSEDSEMSEEEAEPLSPVKKRRNSSFGEKKSSGDEENTSANSPSFFEAFFSRSFADSGDEYDVTWIPDEEQELWYSEISTDDCCDSSNSEEDEESTGADAEPVVTKIGKKSSSSNDSDEVAEEKDSQKKNKKHKIFRFSMLNFSDVLTPNLEESTPEEQTSKHKNKNAATSSQNKKSANKKQSSVFDESKNFKKMQPETSETGKKVVREKKGRKRRLETYTKSDEELDAGKMKGKGSKRLKTKGSEKMMLDSGFKPSAGLNERSGKRRGIKPSTKAVSGWKVTKMF